MELFIFFHKCECVPLYFGFFIRKFSRASRNSVILKLNPGSPRLKSEFKIMTLLNSRVTKLETKLLVTRLDRFTYMIFFM